MKHKSGAAKHKRADKQRKLSKKLIALLSKNSDEQLKDWEDVNKQYKL